MTQYGKIKSAYDLYMYVPIFKNVLNEQLHFSYVKRILLSLFVYIYSKTFQEVFKDSLSNLLLKSRRCTDRYIVYTRSKRHLPKYLRAELCILRRKNQLTFDT